MTDLKVTPLPYIQDEMENTNMMTLDRKPSRSVPAMVIGSVAGIVASTAAGYFLKAHKPVMDSKVKKVVLDVGLGLIGGTIGTIVSNDISEQVDEAIDTIDAFREEVNARKAAARARKEVEIV